MDMACAFGRPNGTNFGVLVGALLTWIVYLPAIGLPAMLSIVRVCINFGIYRVWKAANLDSVEVLRYE
jgi:hypothetical protein